MTTKEKKSFNLGGLRHKISSLSNKGKIKEASISTSSHEHPSKEPSIITIGREEEPRLEQEAANDLAEAQKQIETLRIALAQAKETISNLTTKLAGSPGKANQPTEKAEQSGKLVIDKANLQEQELPQKLDDDSQINLLCEAAEKDEVSVIKNILVTNPMIINSLDKHGNTALHYAVSNENWGAIEVLLQNKANPNIQDEDGLTALHLAAANNYRQIAKMLLKNGAGPNDRDKRGNTPLHFAAEQNNLETLKILVENGGNVNAVNEYGWSVLHGAASGIIDEREDWTIMKWLILEKKVDTEFKDVNDFSVRDIFSQKDWSYAAHYDKLLEEVIGIQKTESRQLAIPSIKS